MKQDELFDDEQYFKDSNPEAYNELESIIKITYGTEIRAGKLKAFSRKIGIFRCPDKNHIYFSYIKERSNPETDCGCTVCKNNREPHKIKLIKCRIHSASNRDIAESIWYCTECYSLFCKRDYVASEIDDDPHECSKQSSGNRIMDLYPDIAEEYSSDNIFPLEGLEYHIGTYFLNDEPLRWNCKTCKRTYTRTYEERVIHKRDECPYCTGEMVPYEESLAHLYPEIAIRWQKWNTLKASEVFGNGENNHNKNTSRGWFSCKGCGIPYYNTIENEIKGGYDCEYCNVGLTKELSEQIFEEAYNAGSWDRNSRHINLSRKSPIDFKCEKCGNLFQASPYERFHLMKECPHCLLEQKHLKNSHPELMSEWDFANNEKFAIYPDNILETSNVKVFWKCKVCSGSYRISVKRKVSGKYDCPYCTNKRVLPGFNSFKKLHEDDLMKEWDFESNSNYVDPDRILPTVISKVFWNCPVCKGTYRASVAGRISGEETCPYCANKEALPGLNSFMYLHKDDLMNEWDFESNVDIADPDHILPTVKTIVYWNCSVCGGNYDASVAGRVFGEETCPYCANKKALPGFNSFMKLHENDLMNEWDFELNADIENPDCILPTITKTVYWNCSTCGGNYKATVRGRHTGEETCPYCNNRKVLPGFNSFMKLYEHDILMKEWDFKMNANIADPDLILPTATKTVFWNCQVCGGNYPSSIRGRVSGEEICPYCNNRRALPGFNSFMKLYEHDVLMKEWDFELNADIADPDHILPTTTKIVFWNCQICGGNYHASVKEKTSGEEPCPYCSNRKVLPGFNSFMTIHQDDLMYEWDKINNYLLCNPDYILCNFPNKVWWICNKCGYKYQMSPKQRVYYQKRHMKSCPFCKGLRQKKVHFF